MSDQVVNLGPDLHPGPFPLTEFLEVREQLPCFLPNDPADLEEAAHPLSIEQ